MMLSSGTNLNDGLDSELDTIGIKLEHPVFCGKCKVKMISSDKKNFSCPKCGKKYLANNLD